MVITYVVPIFNGAKYLHKCLDSIVNQTHDELDIICIDDASSDDSLKIITDYASRDPRIRILVNKSNSGPGVSRNRGIDEAKGEFIIFVDADDWVDENQARILCMVHDSILSGGRADIICFNALMVDSSANPIGPLYDPGEQNARIPKYRIFQVTDCPSAIMMTNAFTYMVRKEFLHKYSIRFKNPILFEDWDFNWNVYSHDPMMLYIDKLLYCYRIDVPTSSMHTMTCSRLEDGSRTALESLRYFMKFHDDEELQLILYAFAFKTVQRFAFDNGMPACLASFDWVQPWIKNIPCGLDRRLRENCAAYRFFKMGKLHGLVLKAMDLCNTTRHVRIIKACAGSIVKNSVFQLVGRVAIVLVRGTFRLPRVVRGVYRYLVLAGEDRRS